jgi:hypothetical protein
LNRETECSKKFNHTAKWLNFRDFVSRLTIPRSRTLRWVNLNRPDGTPILRRGRNLPAAFWEGRCDKAGSDGQDLTAGSQQSVKEWTKENA